MVKEKELSSATKCRRTKLRKKSINELVNIILRKDDIERKLSKTIDTYKKLQLTNEKRIEILKDYLNKNEDIQSNQEKTIDIYKKLQLTNEKRIKILKDSLDKSEEIQNNQKMTIDSLNTTLNNKITTISTLKEHNKSLYDRIDVLEKTIKARNKEARILFAIIVALIISIIILFFI